MIAAKTRKVSAITPSTWNCCSIVRWPITGSLFGRRISDVDVRNCSMIDTDASGS
ncbi:MAG: hypothetical protein IPI40_07180 [Betaproteobacteria bacterium]|nr:hypothetical protein [Betaproteobacteria bacterium]